MDDDLSPVACARLASALTTEEAATAIGTSRSNYVHLEERPLGFTLGELYALSSELNDDGLTYLNGWINGLFASKTVK